MFDDTIEVLRGSGWEVGNFSKFQLLGEEKW
jgi:hypothetical protein